MLEPRAIRKHVDFRLACLKAERQSYDPHWQDIVKLMRPRTGRFLLGGRERAQNRGGKRNDKIHDSHAIHSAKILQNGIASGLLSASRPWFKLQPEDPVMVEWGPVKTWVEDFQTRMYSFLAGTNVYDAAKTCFGELGLFGVCAAIIMPSAKRGMVVHPLSVGEYWLGAGEDGEIDTLYRLVEMSVKQLVERFGIDKVSQTVRSAYGLSQYDQTIICIHAIEPNWQREPGRLDARNKRWISVYFEEGAKQDELLSVSGFDRRPFFAARWDTVGADIYSGSPGMDALPDVQQLMLNAINRMQVRELLRRPPMGLPASMQQHGRFPNLAAGSMHALSAADAGVVKPLWEVRPESMTVLMAERQELTQSIDRTFYVDLFMAITRMEGVQPRNIEEITARNAEKMTQLGPVVERLFSEMLRPIVDRAGDIMAEFGLVPPVPEDLSGADLGVQFTSILAEMQRQMGLGSIERTLSFIGNLAAVWPAITDKIDADQAVDEYAKLAGAPARMVRTDEAVEDMRGQRQQMEQAAQMAEMAPGVKAGAEAAALLADLRNTVPA